MLSLLVIFLILNSSDQSDPFNRSPLKLQDVIPATDLKNEIEKWKLSKMSQKWKLQFNKIFNKFIFLILFKWTQMNI